MSMRVEYNAGIRILFKYYDNTSGKKFENAD